MKARDCTAEILGSAVRLPDQPIAQQEVLEHAISFCATNDRQRQVLSEVYRRTGILTRCSALSADERATAEQRFFSRNELRGPSTAVRMQRYAKDAPPLAITVSTAALQDAGVHPSQITHLVTASCTGFSAPGFDIELILNLPLSPTVQRTHLGFMGCHGALNALRIAKALAEADARHRVLVCCVELCSLHFQYGWNSDNIVANSLFADGAAAIVIAPGGTKPASAELATRLAATHSVVIPDTKDLMSWRIGDHGFQMTLSNTVPEVVKEMLPQVLTRWLADQNLAVEQIRGWAIHPGGPRIIDAVAQALSLDEAAVAPSWSALASYGNMSSPTVLFILDALRKRGDFLPCVVMAFGPGLTVELALLRGED